ncbi:hypothetical protein V1282_006138 [Nitrobacteraceae bacterium AZCC 2146]
MAFGTLIGPSAAGFAFDLNHSYTLPIVASACANGGKVSIKAQIPVGAEETIAGALVKALFGQAGDIMNALARKNQTGGHAAN